MKVLLALVGLVVVVSHAVVLADQELANKLKPFEAFSPYPWTQWVAMKPSRHPQPIAAAAVAYAPQPQMYSLQDSTDEDDSDEDDDDDDDALTGPSAFASWFKRAILPQPPPVPVTKKPKKVKTPIDPEDITTKKPSIVELPPGFWGPPTIANLTFPPPPGYYAAKKSMFISKLFAALAASVLNETVPEDFVATTTTPSPRQAILNQISEVLLTDVARSITASDEKADSDEFEDSDEESASSEETVTAASRKLKTVKPTQPTVNPFLLSQLDFLAKLTEAIAATQQEPTTTTAPVTTTTTPTPTKPTTTTTAKPTKKGKKATKKSAKKGPTTPKYMKYIPVTTTTPTPPTTEQAAPVAQEFDYDALARALLGSSKI